MIVHLAGPWHQVAGHLRQRCSWCGALLVDEDLARVAVPTGQNGPPVPTWEVGALVAVDGAAWWTIEPELSDPSDVPGAVSSYRIPADSCFALPPELTRAVTDPNA